MNKWKSFDVLGSGQPQDITLNLRWLRTFLLMHVATRTYISIPHYRGLYEQWFAWASWLLVICCVIGLIPALARRMSQFAAGLMAVQIVGTLPQTANHIFIEFICVALCALLDERHDGERELLVKALRSFILMFFFYSGLQKVLYGRYFDGQFLAYFIAVDDRFAFPFRYLMPADEFQRLQAMQALEVGTGPYRVQSAAFLIISNSVYLFEMAAPVFLVLRKTRCIAAVATIAFVIAIELGAKELCFGMLTINLIALFLPGRWIRWLFPFCAALYLYLLVASHDLVPMFHYIL